jgi:hypothetical protein
VRPRLYGRRVSPPPRSSTLSLLALFAALPLGVSPLNGQSLLLGHQIDAYTFRDPAVAGLSTISVATTPVTLGLGLGGWAALSARAAYARGVAEGGDGSTVVLEGMTDTEVVLALMPFGADFSLSAIANVPSGRYGLTLDEALIGGVVATELLPFPVKSWGSGASIGGEMQFLRQIGPWGVALVGSYRAAQAYDPLQDFIVGYRPGDQLSARFALDRDVGDAGTLGVVFGYTDYSGDQSGGLEIFQAGARLEAQMSYGFPLGRAHSGLLYGLAYLRQSGTPIGSDPNAQVQPQPAQQLGMLGGSLRFSLGRRAAFTPGAEVRLFLAGDEQSQGWMYAGTGSLEVRLAGRPTGTQLLLVTEGGYRQGNVIVTEGLATGVQGWGVNVMLVVEAR